jgi:hypothetical protein
MDGERFDTIAKGLATGSSRRRLIGGLIGGAAAALAGTTTLAAKRKKGKGRKAKVRAQSGGEGKGQEKVTLCHWDEDTQRYERITVGAPGADAHLRQHTDEDHPDFKFTDEFKCCNASTCEAAAGPCRELRACDEEGHCEYTNIKQGEPCPIGDDDGMCINGECRLLSTGNTCSNADPCAQGIECGTPGGERCVCYSSTEQGNICIRGTEATCSADLRPDPCNSSSECGPEEFCAPLDRSDADNPTGNCCRRQDVSGFRGFCVPVSAACTAVA